MPAVEIPSASDLLITDGGQGYVEVVNNSNYFPGAQVWVAAPGVKATLDLGTLAAGNLDSILQANSVGTAGNDIQVDIVADPGASPVNIVQISDVWTIQYEDGVATVADVEAAIAATSDLPFIVLTSGSGATVLNSPGDDTGSPGSFSGGEDEVPGTLHEVVRLDAADVHQRITLRPLAGGPGPSYGLSDMSDYTTAALAFISQSAQSVAVLKTSDEQVVSGTAGLIEIRVEPQLIETTVGAPGVPIKAYGYYEGGLIRDITSLVTWGATCLPTVAKVDNTNKVVGYSEVVANFFASLGDIQGGALVCVNVTVTSMAMYYIDQTFAIEDIDELLDLVPTYSNPAWNGITAPANVARWISSNSNLAQFSPRGNRDLQLLRKGTLNITAVLGRYRLTTSVTII